MKDKPDASNENTEEEDEAVPEVHLHRLELTTFNVGITGTAPLIVNNFSQKAKDEMRDAQGGVPREKAAPKDPVALFEGSKFLLPDGSDAFPARAFKAAIVRAGAHFKKLHMTTLRTALRVNGQGLSLGESLVPLTYGKCRMREDYVRIGKGLQKTTDLRYRAEYWPWSAELDITVIAGQFNIDSVFALVDAAGFGGVGEWRPSSKSSDTGTFGTFEVKT